jgi:hypothetical protein
MKQWLGRIEVNMNDGCDWQRWNDWTNDNINVVVSRTQTLQRLLGEPNLGNESTPWSFRAVFEEVEMKSPVEELKQRR